jgi:hypothetical protein
MKLKEVREITGLSERTLKSYIQQGRLEATLVGSGQHRHWEINPESLEQIEWKPKDDTDNTQQSDQQLLITAQQHQLEIYERELEAKNKQIEQLHILLQQAQAALPAPRENRPWWKFWRK